MRVTSVASVHGSIGEPTPLKAHMCIYASMSYLSLLESPREVGMSRAKAGPRHILVTSKELDSLWKGGSK